MVHIHQCILYISILLTGVFEFIMSARKFLSNPLSQNQVEENAIIFADKLKDSKRTCWNSANNFVSKRHRCASCIKTRDYCSHRRFREMSQRYSFYCNTKVGSGSGVNKDAWFVSEQLNLDKRIASLHFIQYACITSCFSYT